MFRGMVREMAHEDNSEKSSYGNPNGGSCDGVSGSLVNKGKSISTRPSPRKGRRRGSGSLQLEKKESPHPSSSSPYQCRYSDTVLPVNPNFDLAQSTDLPLNPKSSDIPEKNGLFMSKMEELAKSLGFVDPPFRTQGKAGGPRLTWSESLSRVSSNYNVDLLHEQRLPMNSTLPLPGLHQQHTFPMHASLSSSPSSSSSSSSLMRFMEPPSNQINSNSVSSLWPQQAQSGSTKRPYPYSVDSVILDFKEAAPRMQRDGPSSSTSASETNANIKNMRSNDTVTRDFLTLAPQAPPSPPAKASRISRFRHPNPAASILPYHVESVDFSSLPYQMEADGEAREDIFVQGAYRWNQQPVRRCRYHDFFSPVAEKNGQATTSNGHGGSNGGEGGKSLDLELRLRPANPSERVEDDNNAQ